MLKLLRPYQMEVLRAAVESVVDGRGDTLTVQVARQGGKNETSACLEVTLLTARAAHGGEIVKCAPTFSPQCRVSIRRLKDRLRRTGLDRLARWSDGNRCACGLAGITFLSAGPEANVVGHTASLLLEADEAQDIDPERFDRDFRPMASSGNATTVLYGTPWDDFSLLERQKQHNLELERADGRRRHFEFDWQVVAEHNPGYGRYVEAERERLGAEHPVFLTQYCLQTVSGGGRLFTLAHLHAMQGDHPPGERAVPGRTYVAGLDVAGQDFGGEGSGRRDSTVLTVAEVVPGDPLVDAGPLLRVRFLREWTGTDHGALLEELALLLGDAWRVSALTVDATGAGETLAGLLRRRLPQAAVRPFKFTTESKSRLGFALLAAVAGGRVRMHNAATEEQAAFWRQARMARRSFRPNQRMNFFVEERDGHDDYLMSLALCLEAAEAARPRTARGRAA